MTKLTINNPVFENRTEGLFLFPEILDHPLFDLTSSREELLSKKEEYRRIIIKTPAIRLSNEKLVFIWLIAQAGLIEFEFNHLYQYTGKLDFEITDNCGQLDCQHLGCIHKTAKASFNNSCFPINEIPVPTHDFANKAINALQASKEVTDCVKLMVAAFDYFKLQNFIRFRYAIAHPDVDPSKEFSILFYPGTRYDPEEIITMDQMTKFLEFTSDKGFVHHPFKDKHTDECMWGNIDNIDEQYTTKQLYKKFLTDSLHEF